MFVRVEDFADSIVEIINFGVNIVVCVSKRSKTSWKHSSTRKKHKSII